MQINELTWLAFPKKLLCFFVATSCLCGLNATNESIQQGPDFSQEAPPRLIVTTDIGQDPDDMQSMIRLLHYANEFRIEGIIANADNNHKGEPPIVRDDLLHELIDAYAAVRDNLERAIPGFPTADQLRKTVKQGCAGNGVSVPVETYIGAGKDTEGSQWIIDVVDREDPDPVCVAVWGGACDLAQALWHVRAHRSEEAVEKFVNKLRVFFIGKQDSSNDWILSNFPGLWVILGLHPSGDKWQSGYRGMFWGGNMETTSREWLTENIVSKNPLASLYPLETYTGGDDKNPYGAMKEGDSPSFLYFLPVGFNTLDHPEWGSWGGRYELEGSSLYIDAADTVYDVSTGEAVTTPRATVFRWRDDAQKDFLSRCAWAGGNYSELPGHSQIEVNGTCYEGVVELEVKASEWLQFSIKKSDSVEADLIYYSDAGSYAGDVECLKDEDDRFVVKIPEDAASSTIHVVVRLSHGEKIGNVEYHRLVLHVK